MVFLPLRFNELDLSQISINLKCLKLRLHALRLIGPISYLGACYIYTKVTKCIREKMTMCFRE